MPTTDMYAFVYVRRFQAWLPPYLLMGGLCGPLVPGERGVGDDSSGCGDGCHDWDEPAAEVRAAQYPLCLHLQAARTPVLIAAKTNSSSLLQNNSPCASFRGEAG